MHWVFRVKSCVWQCCGFSGTKFNTIIWSGTKCNTIVCTVWALILDTVPNIIPWFCPAPIITLSLGPIRNVILCSGVGYYLWQYRLATVLIVTIYWHGTTVIISWSRLSTPIPVLNVISLCTTTLVPNVIIMIGLILVMAPNVVPGSLFINLLCAHVVFERSTDKERHNPPGTSDGRADSLEQNRLGVGNSKIRRALPQQLTMIYWNVLV